MKQIDATKIKWVEKILKCKVNLSSDSLISLDWMRLTGDVL